MYVHPFLASNYAGNEPALWLEYRLRRRFRFLEIWVETGGWDSTFVTVSVRSKKHGTMEIIVISCLNEFGELDIRDTYKKLRGKIKEWNRSLKR